MNYSPSKSVVSKKRGVVLLIAILISSVALAVGVGVYTRTYKELLLSSFWKQSQIAFGAADAGLECALYWETHPSGGQVDCFGNSSIGGWLPGSSGAFVVDAYDGCARVKITKDPLAVPPAPSTIIESRGQSEICSPPGGPNPRRVERAVKLSY